MMLLSSRVPICIGSKTCTDQTLVNSFTVPGSQGDNIEIPAGKHEYEFTFVLPESDIPTSYSDDIGFVMYSIKATMDRPWAKDYKTGKYFTVINMLDLNTIPGAGVNYYYFKN